MRINQIWIILTAVLVLAGCGGGSSSPSASSSTSSSGTSSTSSGASNSIAVVVNQGPAAAAPGTFNIPYTSVQVCEPNTTNCAIINNLQIDTGSTGLRIFASVLRNAGISLSPMTDPNVASATIGECLAFVDGYVWGPVSTADVHMGNETATNLSVHVIDDVHSYQNVPTGCTQLTSSTSLNSVSAFLANGTLGVGVFAQDCGASCAQCATMGGCTTTDDNYYSCSNASGTCTPTQVALDSQVDNPITFFATDNNGSILSLNSVPSSGQATGSGTLTFGIGTQSNNALPSSAAVLLLDSSGFFTTTFQNQTLDNSFIDSGSNAYFFADNLPTCGNSSPSDQFYCPSSTTQLQAVNQGHTALGTLTGNTNTVNFQIANLNSLLANGDYAYNNVGGTAATSTGTNSLNNDFDFGLPFFYGRSVYTAIEGQTTQPYFAY